MFNLMDRITLHDKTFVPYIPYEKIMSSIDAVAAQLNADFKGTGKVPVLLCVLNGSIMFTAEIMKRLEFDCELVSTKLSSYEGTSSSGQVKQALGLTSDITGKTVIVIEDIVDTGNTIVELDRILREKGASDIRMCTMLLKPEVYDKDIKLDYVAMEIDNSFIVGFGLDYNQLGRNYKDIYILEK